MTADPHTTNSGPGEPLYASVATSTPSVGVSLHPDPLSGPLRAVCGLSLEPATPPIESIKE